MMIKHLYIHIPFCSKICHYCDFAKSVYMKERANQYLDKLIADLNKNDYRLKDVKTIYIGGGTPTSLNLKQLEKLFISLSKYQMSVKEYTIEINPENTDSEKIKLFKKYGINRISIGVQSADPYYLKLMNRGHCFEDVESLMNELRKNSLNNISIDIIYSLPNQDLIHFKNDLKKLISLKANHISIYSLSIEKNTAFYYRGIKNLDDDLEADLYEYLIDYLNHFGYEQYEVSSFTNNQAYSLHNLAYWQFHNYLGLGQGACSKIDDMLITNSNNLLDYLNDRHIKVEKLNTADLLFDHLMMSLRTKFGIDINYINQLYKIDFLEKYKSPIQKWQDYLIIRDDHLICNKPAILNEILLDFFYND